MGREDREGANGKVPETSFSVQNAPKNFGGRAPPGPTGELKRILRLASRSGAQGREHSLVAVMTLSGEEEYGSTWKWRT